MSHYQLNFFPVIFPDNAVFPLLVRDLPKGEALRPFEARLTARESEGPAAAKAVVVTAVEKGLAGYATEQRALRDLPTGILRRLLEDGLRTALSSRGHLIDRSLTEFNCYRPDDLFTEGTPSFLKIRRGAQFRSDSIFVANRRTIGFFVSSRSKVFFADGLGDAAVAKAAIGARVRFASPEANSGKLIGANNGEARVEIQTRNEDAAREIKVASATVEVPGSLEVLRTYCKGMPGGPALFKEALAAPKRASGRITATGTKNRRWAIAEFDYVAMWLNSESRMGRVPFTWPNSELELALDTHPTEVRLGA